MWKLQDLRVEFDKAKPIYEPGDIVSGRVHLKHSEPKNVKEIRLEVKGASRVHWTKEKQVDYHSEELYFTANICLLGHFNNGRITALVPAGDNVYDFQFELPPTLPCSIEHTFGHIRYTLTAILDRPHRHNRKVVAAFTVIQPYNLNAVPGLTNGINESEHKRFQLWFSKFGELKLEISTAVTGFVPGERIDVTVSYDNRADFAKITKMKIKLHKILNFIARTPKSDSKCSVELVAEKRCNDTPNKRGKAILSLVVPPVPPSHLKGCAIIELAYALEVCVHLSGIHSPIVRSFPIEIGTIPLDRPSSPTNSVPSITVSDESDPPPQYPDGTPSETTDSMTILPPPTYEQCISGSNHIVDQNSEGLFGTHQPFSPMYPVYKFPVPYH